VHIYKIHSTYKAEDKKEKEKEKRRIHKMGYHVTAHPAHLLAPSSPPGYRPNPLKRSPDLILSSSNSSGGSEGVAATGGEVVMAAGS
jgi:hypothetical protein